MQRAIVRRVDRHRRWVRETDHIGCRRGTLLVRGGLAVARRSRSVHSRHRRPRVREVRRWIRGGGLPCDPIRGAAGEWWWQRGELVADQDRDEHLAALVEVEAAEVGSLAPARAAIVGLDAVADVAAELGADGDVAAIAGADGDEAAGERLDEAAGEQRVAR